MANKPLKTIKFPGLDDTYTVPQIDTTLAVSGKAADAKAVGDELTNLKQDLIQLEGDCFELSSHEYTLAKLNKRIALGGLSVGDTVDLTPVSSANLGYVIISCVAGEEFVVTANAGTGNLPWAFIDSSNKVLSIATSVSTSNTIITAPTNTSNLIFVYNANSTKKLIRGKNRVGLLEGEVKPLALTISNGEITANGSTSSATSYRKSDAVFVKAGQKLSLTASAFTDKAVLSEWSSEGSFIQTLIRGEGSGSDNVKTWTYTAPRDMYLRVCYYNSTGFGGYISEPTNFTNAKSASDLADDFSTIPYEWERVLNAVCCIGDSLTAGSYYVNEHDGSPIEQNYPYFFAKQTGLTVQNEGLGGSSPSSRWSYFSTYDFTPYNAFFIWFGTNGGLTDTLQEDGVIDENGDLISDYMTYEDTNTGDYCKIIGKIISQVPHAKIFLGTIYTTTGDAGTTNAVIRKIGALYPDNVMGVVDNNDGTLYTRSDKRLTPSWVHIDNITHFSMVGNYYLAVHWIKAIRAVIAENPAKFEDIMEDILASD